MIVYAASTLFHSDGHTNNYPSFATEACYRNIDSFLDFCELSARHKSEFSTSDVYINCIKTEIYADGTVKVLEDSFRIFKNYRSK